MLRYLNLELVAVCSVADALMHEFEVLFYAFLFNQFLHIYILNLLDFDRNCEKLRDNCISLDGATCRRLAYIACLTQNPV